MLKGLALPRARHSGVIVQASSHSPALNACGSAILCAHAVDTETNTSTTIISHRMHTVNTLGLPCKFGSGSIAQQGQMCSINSILAVMTTACRQCVTWIFHEWKLLCVVFQTWSTLHLAYDHLPAPVRLPLRLVTVIATLSVPSSGTTVRLFESRDDRRGSGSLDMMIQRGIMGSRSDCDKYSQHGHMGTARKTARESVRTAQAGAHRCRDRYIPTKVEMTKLAIRALL